MIVGQCGRLEEFSKPKAGTLQRAEESNRRVHKACMEVATKGWSSNQTWMRYI